MREAGVEVGGGDGQGVEHVQDQAALHRTLVTAICAVDGNVFTVAEGRTRTPARATALCWATGVERTRKTCLRG